MNRYQAFNQLLDDPYYGPKIKKLPSVVITFILKEIEKTIIMDPNEFSDYVRNLFIGDPNRSSFWALIDEILMACNSRALNGKQKEGTKTSTSTPFKKGREDD